MAFFINQLKEKGHLENTSITVFCVGSRKLGQGDDLGSQAWGMFAPHLKIYGFDADADACEMANANLAERDISWKEIHVPLALSDTNGEATLYVTHAPMCSSLYPPDEEFLSRFNDLPELVNLDFTVDIETTTLDTFCQEEGIQHVDFLQMDVQGAELLVLEGASKLLEQGIFAIQAEVSFEPLYKEQPLFADVDKYLRAKGFSFFDFEFRGTPGTRRRSPVRSPLHPGQRLWADAIYFFDLLALDKDSELRTPENIFKLACVSDAIGFVDYSLELLEYLTINYGKTDARHNYADCIVSSLAAMPALIEKGLSSLEIVQNLEPFLSQDCCKQYLQ